MFRIFINLGLTMNTRLPRYLFKVLEKRVVEKSPLIQVVLGPRQIGKTTAVKQLVEKYQGFYETADFPVSLSFDEIDQWWSQAKLTEGKLLVLDEVQKILSWSEVVKRLWDKEEGLKVVLTGSSSLLMEKGLKETLAGRYEVIRAEHWNYGETQEIFEMTLAEYVEFGCYPGSNRFLKDTSRWGEYIRDSIIEPVIGPDLLQMHPVDNPALLRQIFGVAASLPA